MACSRSSSRVRVLGLDCAGMGAIGRKAGPPASVPAGNGRRGLDKQQQRSVDVFDRHPEPLKRICGGGEAVSAPAGPAGPSGNLAAG